MLLTRLVTLATCCALSRAANFDNMRLFERLGLGRTADGDSSPHIHSLKSPGNSPMFVIRLPPSPYYYLNHIRRPSEASTPSPDFAHVPLDFTINGRPDKLYHYNLGVTPPMVDGVETSTAPAPTTTPTATTTTTAASTTTAATTAVSTSTPSTVRAKVSVAERLRQKYTEYFKGNRAGSAMKKYKYSYNGRPSSFYVMRGSGDRKPVYYRRFV